MVISESGQRAYSQAEDGEHVLSLRDVTRIILKRIWVIGLVIVLFVGIAGGFSIMQAPKYVSSVKILVGQKQDARDSSKIGLGSEVEGLQRLTKTLTEAVSSRRVAEAVIERLDLNMTPENLLANLKVQQIPETQFVRVSYTDTNPERAQQVANATGEVVSQQVSEVASDAYDISATVWEPATVPGNPVSPNWMLNSLLALMLGAAVGLGLVFLLEYFDDSWRSPEEVERTSGVPNLSVIPRFEVPREPLETGGK